MQYIHVNTHRSQKSLFIAPLEQYGLCRLRLLQQNSSLYLGISEKKYIDGTMAKGDKRHFWPK